MTNSNIWQERWPSPNTSKYETTENNALGAGPSTTAMIIEQVNVDFISESHDLKSLLKVLQLTDI